MIFRYFIEWLRIELREEAFQGYIKRAKRKAQSMKKQQHKQYQQKQKQKEKNPSKPEKKTADGESSWTASLPGWVQITLDEVSAEVDEWYDWLTEEEDPKINNNDDDDDIDYRQTQFWELAKLEGDEKWIEWLQTHIWTVSFISSAVSQ